VANRVAQSYHHLRWSPAPQDRELARRLDTRYRNANVRVAISQELINRLLPSPDEIEGPVREEILGARVVGRSRAKTRLKVTLLPHGRQWRLGLDVEGDVTSDTSATKGPATFFNEGASRFSARKVLLVDDRAVRTRWAAAVADSNEDLIRVRTNYDGLPLLGPVARAVAIRQHDLRRDDAKWETEAKLAAKASSQLDQAVRQQIREAAGRFHAKVLKPLKTIELNPRVMDMETTSERLVARCCLAGDDQLAAQTARPRAFSDSLLSVQIHETGVNNAIEKLQWDGKRANLMDLHHEIAKAFNRPELGVPEDFPKDVTVQFAPAEAVRVRCDNGRAVLTLKLAELAAGHGKRWKDFVVRAYYRPDASDLSARLVRDENFDLIGQRLSLGDRVALRGIFAKVFSRRRPLCIIGQQLAEKPQLQDLHVTQFAVDNGWVGVALGPQRVASNKPTRVAADGREPALTNDE
jgi:hypothetical protein